MDVSPFILLFEAGKYCDLIGCDHFCVGDSLLGNLVRHYGGYPLLGQLIRFCDWLFRSSHDQFSRGNSFLEMVIGQFTGHRSHDSSFTDRRQILWPI